MPGVLWTEQEKNLLRRVYPYFSNKEIQKKYFPKRTVESIKTQGVKKLKLCKKITSQRIGSVEPLLTNTPKAFYWMGFIFADGSVINNKTRLSISLANKDHEHLIKLALYLSTNTKVYIEDGWKKHQPFCKIRIQDKERIPKLCEKFNIKPNKTYNPPTLNITDDKFFISFLCGFIDGDGCITINKNRKNCISISIKVHGSWLDTLKYFERRVYESLNIKEYNKTNRTHLNKNGFAVLRLSDNTLIRQLKLHALKFKLPIMNRKWDKINTNLTSKYETARQRTEAVQKMLDIGMYPAQISYKLQLKLTTTYAIIRKIKQLNK